MTQLPNLQRLHAEFNRRWFGNRLRSIPVLVVDSMPYGKSLGQFRGNDLLVFKNAPNPEAVLLHEMVHQMLSETGRAVAGKGRDGRHNNPAWCSAIVELTQRIWGRKVQAAPDRIGKVRGPDGKRRSVRVVHAGHLTREEFSGWPWSLGLVVPVLEPLATSTANYANPAAAVATPAKVPQPVPVVQPEAVHVGKRDPISEGVVPAPAAPKRRRKSLREPSEDPHVRQFSVQLHNRLEGSRLYVRGLVDHFRRPEFCRQLLEAMAAAPVNTKPMPATIDGVSVCIVKLYGNRGGYMVRVQPA